MLINSLHTIERIKSLFKIKLITWYKWISLTWSKAIGDSMVTLSISSVSQRVSRSLVGSVWSCWQSGAEYQRRVLNRRLVLLVRSSRGEQALTVSLWCRTSTSCPLQFFSNDALTSFHLDTRPLLKSFQFN